MYAHLFPGTDDRLRESTTKPPEIAQYRLLRLGLDADAQRLAPTEWLTSMEVVDALARLADMNYLAKQTAIELYILLAPLFAVPR